MRTGIRGLLAALAVSATIGMGSVPDARAAVRTVIPDEDPGPPFYARIERPYAGGEPGGTIHTDEWAAIIFYRSSACVPADFNLLDFFDVPAAFGCALTVEGFEVWANGGPPADQAPLQALLRGTGNVPVWFVSWPALQAAMTDDVITITELRGMPSLREGRASYFHETLHPTGGAERGNKLEINARGTLVDGGSFRLHASRTLGSLRATGGFAVVRTEL